jgi:tetratricopeptide (TPR) repeat protein
VGLSYPVVSVPGVSLIDVSESQDDEQPPQWAWRLRRYRLARELSVQGAAAELRLHARHEDAPRFPTDEDMARTWRRWESGKTKMPEEFYRAPIAKMFGSVPASFFEEKGVRNIPCLLTDDETAELIQRMRRSDVDEAAMQQLRHTVDRLCTDYASQPAPVVLANALTWLEHVNALLDHRLSLAQHQQALSMAGWLTLLASCLHYDLGDDTGAEAARLQAKDIASEVREPEIAGWASEIKAWMALTRGDYYATIAAAQEGMAAAPGYGVAVQLHAQASKAWARIRNRDEAIIEMERGRELLSGMPFPANPRNHFQVDPTKFDFYAMDCWRLTGEDALALAAAETVIRTSTAPDGRAISPMRLAEAELTKAQVLARGGDFDGAIKLAERALLIDRQSLPSLLLSAREVTDELLRIKPGDSSVTDLARYIGSLAGGVEPEGGQSETAG